MLTKIVILLTFLLFLKCGSFVTFEPSIPLEILLSAPEEVEINSRNYVLEASLWRDFMPICPPDGQPLAVSIHLVATDSLPFPLSIDATWLWIINGPLVWETGFSYEDRDMYPYQLQKSAIDGPKWGPWIQVDVVVKVVDTDNGESYLIRAPDQWIDRTD